MCNKRGITLIALIITIIVLLILAGVSISLVVGDNGVLSQAQGSSIKTSIAKFEEDANLAYSEIYTEKIQQPNFTGVTEEELVDKLRNKYGYTIISETRGTISPNKTSTHIKNGNTETITFTSNQRDSNYAKIKETYYKINYTNNRISLGEAEDSINGTKILSVESSDEVVATASKTDNTVTIEGKDSGTATITVKYTDNTTTEITADVYTYGATANLGDVYVVDNNNINSKLLQDWKYFYDDGSYIYLIYADYLESSQIPDAEPQVPLLGDGYNVYIQSSSGYGRTSLLEYLNDNTIWSKFATGITNALIGKGLTTVTGITATGAVSVEQFKLSYNTNHPYNSIEYKYVYQNDDYKNDNESSAVAEGYVFRFTDTWAYGTESLGLQNNLLYFPKTTRVLESNSQNSETVGYWLSRIIS